MGKNINTNPKVKERLKKLQMETAELDKTGH